MSRECASAQLDRRLGLSSIAGLAIFCGWGALLLAGACPGDSPFAWIDWLTWLGPGCIVPLGASLARDQILAGELRRWGWWIGLQPIGTGCLTVACALPRGELAAALAAVGVLPAWLLARIGVARIGARASGDALAARVFDLAFITQFIGAFMLATSRTGYAAFGLFEPIVTLAATHFYFAGFALLVIAAEVGCIVRDASGWTRVWRRAWTLVVFAVPAALLAVAAGVMAAPLLELLGALVLASCGVGLGVLLLAVSARTRARPAAILLVNSGLALITASALGAGYAITAYRGDGWPTQPIMIAVHGPLQAIVFAFGGLVGLRLRRGPAAGM